MAGVPGAAAERRWDRKGGTWGGKWEWVRQTMVRCGAYTMRYTYRHAHLFSLLDEGCRSPRAVRPLVYGRPFRLCPLGLGGRGVRWWWFRGLGRFAAALGRRFPFVGAGKLEPAGLLGGGFQGIVVVRGVGHGGCGEKGGVGTRFGWNDVRPGWRGQGRYTDRLQQQWQGRTGAGMIQQALCAQRSR